MNARSAHGFIINPKTSRLTTLKGPEFPSIRDLGDYTPVAEPAAKENSSFIKLRSDDRTAFPKSLINVRAAEIIAKRQLQGENQVAARSNGS